MQRQGMPFSRARRIVLLAALAAPLQAQKPTRDEAIAAAAEIWLASDQTARDQLDATVKVLLEEPKSGIAWLAAQLQKAAAAPNEPRSKGVQSLVGHTALEFLRRQRATGIAFQGQYAALQPLQPQVGEFLFGLLLETPEWYPSTHRVRLVPALRDLQPTLPDEPRAEAIARIVENERLEPEDLRQALAALLWQWGRKEHAQRIVQALVTATGDGSAEDRVQSTLDLADYYVLLREYKQAATAHRSAQTLAKSGHVTLKPVAYYAAACVHTLLGETERGLAAMEQCAELLASPHLDSSLRLTRAMFDSDPELAPLRAQPRWAELMKKAFPSPEPSSGR